MSTDRKVPARPGGPGTSDQSPAEGPVGLQGMPSEAGAERDLAAR